ncbi:MAG: ThuA domain-containing protein [Microscillaceae bacterium]|nr:ThuA domain-containing protein [Microscillaceae bacterium]
MKRILIILGIVAVTSFALYRFVFAKKRFVSVLVFSKTEQFRHASIAAGKKALVQLGKEYNFRVDTTEDANFFKEKNLAKYNVVVFLNTTGDVLNEAQQLEMNRFIQAGGGFVGIHAAADTEYEWPWYGKLVGAYFNGHPNKPNVREADIQLVDDKHISTKMLPKKWHRKDEWYNYKDINPGIQVLLNLDEKSYKGGTNGENHPIAWCHEYDGGRAWYTGLGHTDESYSEKLFLEHLLGGIEYAAGEGNPVNYANANVAPEENRFTKVVLDEQLDEPMELEILPDGKIIFIERDGNIKVFDRKADSSQVIQKMDVFSKLEDGLLGLALDPNIQENNWVYLFYSDPKKSQQNVSRFTMGKDYLSIDLKSEKRLLEIPTQREECCHSAGSMEMTKDGLLYIALGDNTNPHASEGYSPSDERKDRSPWDAQKSSANTQDLRGKILRIKPEANGTYSIPLGNLFSDKKDGRPEIYVMGCRNPYRMSIDQHTGYLYWGEVGPDAGEDSKGRGSRGYDEINQARKAGFFGWPYFVGNNYPYHKYDFAKEASLATFNPEKPLNESPNNTGAKTLPPAQPAFIWYPYGASKEFPMVGEGARNAMAGPVFYLKDYPNNPGRFPEFFDGKLFIYDWMRGWIMAVTMDEKGNYKRMDRFMPSQKFSNPIDMVFGPDGDMYLLEYGQVWFSQNPDARLVHIKYESGNRKPLAKIKADKTVGALPMKVQFSAEESIDYDGDNLSYAWYFGEGEKIDSKEANPTFTFEKAGKHTVRLVIKDPSGLSSEARLDILAGNELPELSWKFTGNRSFYWDKYALEYEVIAKDKEDGTVGNGIDPQNVYVSIEFLEKGYDTNEIAMGHQALQEASLFLLGKQLMDQSDCSACHQQNKKSVGPSYEDIAQKYKGDATALDKLSKKIIAGGGGVWGETIMAAHPQLSLSEAQQMTRYILSLGGDQSLKTKGLALKGNYAFDKHKKENLEGKYILTATYTDKGGDQIGPLTVRDVITLRNPTIGASQFTEAAKAQKFTVTPEMSQGMVKEDVDILMGEAGGFAKYEKIDLSGVKSLTLGVVKAGAYFSGGNIEFRIDSPTGLKIGDFKVSMPLTSLGFDEIKSNIKATEGVHDVYMVFKGKGGKPVCAVVTIFFDHQGVVQ